LQYPYRPFAATLSQADKKRRLAKSARLAVAIGLVATLGLGVAVEGGAVASAVAAVVRDPASMFANRSPGHRGGFLQQTKIKPASHKEHASGGLKIPPVAGDQERAPPPGAPRRRAALS
jgi:hypothetical protein